MWTLKKYFLKSFLSQKQKFNQQFNIFSNNLQLFMAYIEICFRYISALRNNFAHDEGASALLNDFPSIEDATNK